MIFVSHQIHYTKDSRPTQNPNSLLRLTLKSIAMDVVDVKKLECICIFACPFVIEQK